MSLAAAIVRTAVLHGRHSYGYGELQRLCGGQAEVFDLLEELGQQFRVDLAFSRARFSCFTPLLIEVRIWTVPEGSVLAGARV